VLGTGETSEEVYPLLDWTLAVRIGGVLATGPLSLVMLDVDDFKSINDRFGHDVGDDALIAVARAIDGEVRRPDTAFRRGGDEFALLPTPACSPPNTTTAGRTSAPRRRELAWFFIVGRMSARFVHTCIRVRDIDASLAFYERLGFEVRGRLNFESAYNVYLGLPGNGDVLELTVNVGRDQPYDLGEGYNHMALVVDGLDALLAQLAAAGIEPERPPYAPGGRTEYRICFVADPDGYRVELIDQAFPTPQDPPHPSIAG